MRKQVMAPMTVEQALEAIRNYKIILRKELEEAIGQKEARALIKAEKVIAFKFENVSYWYVKLPGMA